jgi:DNA-damage-inducible protein D
MNNELELYKEQNFEEIKHINDDGIEFWYARELSKVLEYTDWRNFVKVINKAKEACINSSNEVSEHIVEVNRVLNVGNNAKMEVYDFMLSRYACYLIVQNADPSKEVVALGQTYFTIQTRRQELLDEKVKSLSEDEKRLKLRNQVKDGNKLLSDTVYEIGARTNKEFAKFHNEGYKGLYGGEGVNQIKNRKGIKKNDNILDFMGSTELAANWFRITQTDEALKNDKTQTLNEANKTHNKVGKEVRKTMIRVSGTKPEDLPTPEKSIKQLEKEEKKKLKS